LARPASASQIDARGEALDVAVLLEQLAGLAQQLEADLQSQGLAAAKVALKVRYADPGSATRSRTLPAPVSRAGDLLRTVEQLLRRTQAGARPVRGLGLQLSGLVPAGAGDRQLDLFSAGS